MLVNKFDEKDRNGDGADAVRQKVSAMLNSDVLPASRVYPGSSRQAYLANRALHELRKNGALPVDEAWVDDLSGKLSDLWWKRATGKTALR
ncbi:putative vimentin [Escherichia coli]|uniref:Putative vimentin n=1 Tax=Escherichia coli TaxID=562 RepID=A0A376UGH7_ECOLX|nr:putative vimentin [Escherichia coli]